MSPIPKTRRRWLRFSLRALLILVTLFGLGMTFVARWHYRAIRQRDAVTALGDGNIVMYEGLADPQNDPPPVPNWLRGLIGFDHFHNVDDVSLSDATDDQLELLKSFPKLESLSLFSSSQFTGGGGSGSKFARSRTSSNSTCMKLPR